MAPPNVTGPLKVVGMVLVTVAGGGLSLAAYLGLLGSSMTPRWHSADKIVLVEHTRDSLRIGMQADQAEATLSASGVRYSEVREAGDGRNFAVLAGIKTGWYGPFPEGSLFILKIRNGAVANIEERHLPKEFRD